MGSSLQSAKAVFFDVDDTLYDFEHSMLLAFRDLRETFPDLFGGFALERMAEAYWSFYRRYDERAKVEMIHRDPDEFRRVMWAGALSGMGLDADEAATTWLRRAHPRIRRPFSDPEGFARTITDVFQSRRPVHWREAMYEGAWELLRELKGRRILGAITNGPSAVQRPKVEALGHPQFFPEALTFVSGEFGVRKPEPAIFLAAAKAAGVEPHECVMVGDAREFDMPSKAVGFRTVLFTGPRGVPDVSNDPYPPDAVARSYKDLRGLLLG